MDFKNLMVLGRVWTLSRLERSREGLGSSFMTLVTSEWLWSVLSVQRNSIVSVLLMGICIPPLQAMEDLRNGLSRGRHGQTFG